MARKLLSALGQHEPELAASIINWQKSHAGLVDMRRQLIKEAEALMIGLAMQERTEPGAGTAVAYLALNWVYGQSQASPDDTAAVPETLTDLVLKDSDSVRSGNISENDTEGRPMAAQQQVLKQMLRSGRLDPVVTAYSEFRGGSYPNREYSDPTGP